MMISSISSERLPRHEKAEFRGSYVVLWLCPSRPPVCILCESLEIKIQTHSQGHLVQEEKKVKDPD